MYRIRFFSSFCDSANCKSVYERLCGPRFEIVTDDSYTHAIIINSAQPLLTIPKENVIGLAFEPPQLLFRQFSQGFIEYAQKHIGKYFIGDTSGLPAPFISQYAFMWHITPPQRTPVKNKLMSIMVSEKQYAPGHKYRHELVGAILSTNFEIDVYGRGSRFFPNDSRIKGEFTDDEPYENYQFHICIENFQNPDYTSEKYTNALLWGTTPIYWGAKNTLFPESTIVLSGDIIKDIMLIRDILHNPEKYRKTIDQNAVRKKISLLHNIDSIFSH